MNGGNVGKLPNLNKSCFSCSWMVWSSHIFLIGLLALHLLTWDWHSEPMFLYLHTLWKMSKEVLLHKNYRRRWAPLLFEGHIWPMYLEQNNIWIYFVVLILLNVYEIHVGYLEKYTNLLSTLKRSSIMVLFFVHFLFLSS